MTNTYGEILLDLMLISLFLNFGCMFGFMYEIKKAKNEVIDAIRKK